MKVFTLSFMAIAVFIGCAQTYPPDNKNTSKAILQNQIGLRDTTFTFEQDSEDQSPAGFTQTATGQPQSLDWKVIRDDGNKVAAQLAKNSGSYFNLLVLDSPGFSDFVLSAKIKAVSGEEGQGGGLLWRYKDNNNYYVARYNPLESNLRLYKVVNGERKQMGSERAIIGSGEWFTLQIEMRGNKMSCSLNGTMLIEEKDKNFPAGSRVGFWTKADAQTYFDDLEIRPIINK